MSELINTNSGGLLDELIEREGRIDRAQRNAYYEIGLELAAIREKELYKVPRVNAKAGKYSFTTWEEYVDERWEMSEEQARRLIQSAQASEKLHQLVEFLPSRESHVRELLKLETDEQRAEVWQRANEYVEKKNADLKPGERPQTMTASVISEEVERFRASLDKDWLTLEEWNAKPEDERLRLFYESKKTLNKQDTASIEWAQWSWNPITGCKHDCPYCYARDIANRFYKQGFEPSIYPARFNGPKNTTVPKQAETDIAFKNIFTGSMADIFGRWVPDEWIRRVIGVTKECPQWNFLFLTKFPQRVHEFEIELPTNAWMGTTVDCQERVANAEKAFAKMTGGTKWLSVEPMLTPLRFKRLDLFDWIVIGGASKSNKTPEWVPPFDWIADLHRQARDNGCKVYHKDNLKMGDQIRLKEFPWEETLPTELPKELKYLGMK
jgi:protein gp37